MRVKSFLLCCSSIWTPVNQGLSYLFLVSCSSAATYTQFFICFFPPHIVHPFLFVEVVWNLKFPVSQIFVPSSTQFHLNFAIFIRSSNVVSRQIFRFGRIWKPIYFLIFVCFVHSFNLFLSTCFLGYLIWI